MSKIFITEVGPRDGLQNEAQPIATAAKLAFIEKLIEAGLTDIEATSFVSPKWVPQLGDAAELWPQLPNGAKFSALVPNLKGLERAMEVGVSNIAIFTAASEQFTLKNINMTIQQSLEAATEVIQTLRSSKPEAHVRGYVSTIVECPYSGRIDPNDVAKVADALLAIGCDEISLGDTIGVAVPIEIGRVASAVSHIPNNKIVWHFHDTRGTAISNVAKALELGYSRFDSSAAGLGGCPYAKGAGGNLATEDLVYFAERNGLETGIKLSLLAQASLAVLGALNRSVVAKAQLAALAD